MMSAELANHESRNILDKATTAAIRKVAERNRTPRSMIEQMDAMDAAKDGFFRTIFEEKKYKEGIIFISKLAVEDSAETKIMRWYLNGGAYNSIVSQWFGEKMGNAIRDEAQEIMKVISGLQRT